MKRKAERHLAALPFGFDRGVKLIEEANAAFAAEAHDVAGRKPFRRPHQRFQREPSSRFISVASMAGSRIAAADAAAAAGSPGMTLVSLTTNASPRRSSSGRSRMVRSSNAAAHAGAPQGAARSPRRCRPQRNAVLRQVEVE